MKIASLTAAALLTIGSTQAATAQNAAVAAKPTAPAKAAPAPAAKPSIFSRMMNAARPTATAAAPARPAAHKASAALVGRVVTARTSTGKTIHYDCGKAGNRNKQACK